MLLRLVSLIALSIFLQLLVNVVAQKFPYNENQLCHLFDAHASMDVLIKLSRGFAIILQSKVNMGSIFQN